MRNNFLFTSVPKQRTNPRLVPLQPHSRNEHNLYIYILKFIIVDYRHPSNNKSACNYASHSPLFFDFSSIPPLYITLEENGLTIPTGILRLNLYQRNITEEPFKRCAKSLAWWPRFSTTIGPQHQGGHCIVISIQVTEVERGSRGLGEPCYG